MDWLVGEERENACRIDMCLGSGVAGVGVFLFRQGASIELENGRASGVWVRRMHDRIDNLRRTEYSASNSTWSYFLMSFVRNQHRRKLVVMKQSGPKPSRFQAREQMGISWHAGSGKYLRVSAQLKSAGCYRSVLIQPHATLPKTREAGRKSTRPMSPAPASTIAQHHVCDFVAPPLE